METYEYCRFYFGSHVMGEDFRMDAFLKNQGSVGWELVQILRNPLVKAPWLTANYTFIFKRRIV